LVPETVLNYITSLQTGNVAAPSSTDSAGSAPESSSSSPGSIDHPQYDPSSGLEDYEQASTLKQEAAEAKDQGDYAKALQLYNQAIVAAPPSALLYANRAIVLEHLGQYAEAAQDCTSALEQNPDSAKAYKIRGELRYQQLNDWHGALSDLNQAQAIDFDPEIATLLKELTQLRKEEEQAQAQARMEQEEKLRKKAQEIKQAKAEAQAAAAANTSSSRSASSAGSGSGAGMPFMPGVGVPGGGGMDPSVMAGIMSDPDLQEAMQNPKVMSAFQDLMSGPGGPMGLMANPAKLQQLMTDPDVGPVLQKLMGKFMGGGGGMPGGMGAGGMPGFGPGVGGSRNDDDLDDIPDLEAMD
jgi:suppressor of tumorigenicity protein 13